MENYKVEAKSRENLRRLAMSFRQYLGLGDTLYFPIVQILDVLPELFNGFNCEIVEDSVFPDNIHADTDIRTGNIRIKESVYERACRGEGRDRMTIAHELGHYLMLCVCGFKLERNFSGAKTKTCCDPEWQAKCFAGELLVTAHWVDNMFPETIAEKCGVSLDAAQVQYESLKKR